MCKKYIHALVDDEIYPLIAEKTQNKNWRRLAENARSNGSHISSKLTLMVVAYFFIPVSFRACLQLLLTFALFLSRHSSIRP